MSNKYLGLSWIISVLSVLCVIVQKNNIERISDVLEHNNDARMTLAQYVVESFQVGRVMNEYQAIDICEAYLTDSTVVVYLPFSLCRACFSSLVFSLQDNGFPLHKVVVLSERTNLEIQSECLARGIKNVVLNVSGFDIETILITRRNRDGQMVSMRYDLGDDYILTLFLTSSSPKYHETVGDS